MNRARELVVACVPMRSNVNLSQIARTASAVGCDRMVVCGNARIIQKIGRDRSDSFAVEVRRSIEPVLRRMAGEGYHVVGLEQATHASSLLDFRFSRKTVLVVGNERLGLSEEVLGLVHDVVEIPVWGMPYSYNAATATHMALFEYCRQFPDG